MSLLLRNTTTRTALFLLHPYLTYATFSLSSRSLFLTLHVAANMFKTLTLATLFAASNASPVDTSSIKAINSLYDGKPEPTEASPCCANACTAPEIKYYSVDHGMFHHPFCGETCLDPKKFSIYHLFEKNLTVADGEHPCSRQFTEDGGFYSVYNSTVTHGVPGLLSVTLDLYEEPSKQ